MLYTPGDNEHKIGKAACSGADSICLDVEDSVAAERKQVARQTIGRALRELDFGRSERLVRINPIGSGMESSDLLATMDGRPNGYVLPKIENAQQVQWVCQWLEAAERARSWDVGFVRLVVIVETALGIVNLREIASSGPRLSALMFGAEDLKRDLGLTGRTGAQEMCYARGALVIHAAAFHLQAIDSVFVDLHDSEGLRRESQKAAQMGYSGKQVIHPCQIEVVQESFTPSDQEIAQAKRTIDAFELHRSIGSSVFALDGRMVDKAIVEAAYRVLEKARAAGKPI